MFRNRFLYIPALAGLILFVFSSCGQRTETIEPIYKTENIQLQDVKIEMWNSIGSSVVEPNLIRKVTRIFFGWIPGVGQLIELPFDLAGILIPPLSSVSHPALPKDGEWNDPKILSILKSIKLGAAYIRITPIAERGPEYKPERCFVFFECRDQEFDDFLSGLSVFLMFKDLKIKVAAGETPEPEETEILLASADTAREYDKEAKILFFNVTDVNLRPYMNKYGTFEVKIIAKGGYPRHKVYLDGKLRLDLEVRLNKQN